MAFIPMTKKVRPWKRGLAGLGLVATSNSQADSLDAEAERIQNQAIQIEATRAEVLANNSGPGTAQLASNLKTKADALFAQSNALSMQAEAARRGQSVRETAAAMAASQNAAAKSSGTISSSIKSALTTTGSPLTSTAPRTAAPGNKAYDIKEDPKYYTKTVDANGNAVYRKVGSSSSTSFSDVLNSIAEVVGVAAPVAERIVQSEQQRKAETLARRAERAAQNGLISTPQPAQGSGIQASTVAYGVGGLVAVGVTLWALSSLLGGGSSTPSVAVVKA